LVVTLAFAWVAQLPDRAQAVPAQAAPGKVAPAAPVSEPVLASAEMMGLSGKLRAVMGTTDALLENPVLKPLLSESTATEAKRWPELKTASGESFTVVTLVPFSEAGKSGYGSYHVGSWPEAGNLAARNPRYEAPAGFIGVTAENQGTNVSESFRMRDFLTH